MDNRYILLPIILLLLTYIITYTVREKFNSQLSFINTIAYSADPNDSTIPNSFTLDTLNNDVPKLNGFLNVSINVSNFSFDNKPNELMLPYLYNYIDNLNTIIIKQKSFLNDFYGNKYFPAYRDNIAQSSVGGISDINTVGDYKLDISAVMSGKGYSAPNVQAIDSSSDNNSCI